MEKKEDLPGLRFVFEVCIYPEQGRADASSDGLSVDSDFLYAYPAFRVECTSKEKTSHSVETAESAKETYLRMYWFLAARLEDAIRLGIVDYLRLAEMCSRKESQALPDPTAKELKALAKERVKDFAFVLHMPEERGGDQRPKEIRELWDDIENQKSFAQKVDELHDLWKHLTSVNISGDAIVQHYTSHDDWLFQLKGDAGFRKLSKHCKRLSDDLILKAIDHNTPSRDREALPLACVHAFHELGYADIYARHNQPEPKPETLCGFYYSGKEWLSPLIFPSSE